MKVSIITYHDEDNYGATLQAYATYRAVKELGYTPEIINLHMGHHEGLFSKIIFSLKRYRFNRFREKFFVNKTRLYKSLEELQQNPPKSDVYLVGSDQTWNPVISKEYALAYFLDFGGEEVKRISYASSFGTSTWNDSAFAKKEHVKRLLSRFSTRLIREDKGVEICKNEFGLDATQVVDPVLLFPSYPEITGSIKQSDGIVVYKIVNDAEFYRRAVTLGKNLSCGVRSIGSLRQLKNIKTAYPERIEKWITNIASAKYVFTDSFHGTVLSLLYHRQFVVYAGDKSKLSRITSILKMVGLENRLFTSEDSIEEIQRVLTTPIDYSKIDRILNMQRANSIDCLRKAVNGYKPMDNATTGGAKSKLLRIPLVKALNDFRINLRDKRELQSRQHLIPQIAKCINDDTTVISNNCFAGRIMQDLNMKYNSPTLGLYIWTPDYIEFVSKLRYYLTEAKLTFVKHSKYPLGDERRSKWSHWYPIGLLDGKVEIQFLHYHSEKEAAEKWYRRAGRINWNNIMVIGMEQNLCTIKDIYDFDKLPIAKKVIFTSRNLSDVKSNIYLKEFDGRDEVGDAYRFSDVYYRGLIEYFLRQ